MPGTQAPWFKGTVTPGGSETKRSVVIKFTATYCKDAHEKLSKEKQAPELLFCEWVESVGSTSWSWIT